MEPATIWIVDDVKRFRAGLNAYEPGTPFEIEREAGEYLIERYETTYLYSGNPHNPAGEVAETPPGEPEAKPEPTTHEEPETPAEPEEPIKDEEMKTLPAGDEVKALPAGDDSVIASHFCGLKKLKGGWWEHGGKKYRYNKLPEELTAAANEIEKAIEEG